MHRLLLALACGSALTTSALQAQSIPVHADSVAAKFHRGEWGIGFTLGPTLAEAGVLRFLSSSAASVLDASGSVSRSSGFANGPFPPSAPIHSELVTALIGPRWYGALNTHVVRFAGLGVSGAYGRYDVTDGEQSQEMWSVGAYGEAGIEYMFTRNVGLGWRGNLMWSRSRSHVTQSVNPPGTSTTNSSVLTVQPIQLTGTIFF